MEDLPLTPLTLHRAPSVGGTVKKILAINPDLNVSDVIALVRQATRPQGASAGEYARVDVIDEARALQLARETLPKGA